MTGAQAAAGGSAANRSRGEAAIHVNGREVLLRPSFRLDISGATFAAGEAPSVPLVELREAP